MKNKPPEEIGGEYSRVKMILILILSGILFILVNPLLLVMVSMLDSLLGLPRFILEPLNLIIGSILVLFGFSFALWAVITLYREGRGTPTPIAPPKRLVTSPPYNLCRNPMALGTILLYLGITIIMESTATLITWTISTTTLLTYIKFKEEKQLEEKYGEEYSKYKQRTPFLIPKRPKTKT